MDTLGIILLIIMLACIAGGLYLGIRLLISGKKRSSLVRGIFGVLITGTALYFAGWLGMGLWHWYDRRTNPVRIFTSQFRVAPPEGVTHLQATYEDRGGFRETYLRWECSAEVLSDLLPDYKEMDLVEHPIKMHAVAREPEWWDLSFAAPGTEIRSRGNDDLNRVILAYDPERRTAWYYSSDATKEFYHPDASNAGKPPEQRAD